MLPVLFQCSFFTVYTYGVFVALAFMVSSWLLLKEARRSGHNEEAVYNLCVVLLISGIAFARMFYVALNWDYFSAAPSEILKLNHGGLVWFGGLIGSVLCGLAYIKFKKLGAIKILDLFAPYVALGQSIGRLGCFFNGCCYGREAEWGIFFPVHGKTLVPSQLLDSMTLALIFLVLRLIQKKSKQGMTFSAYLILASVQRFFIEFIRADVRPFYLSLSIFQWISAGLFLTGVSLYIFIICKKKNI